MAAPLKDRFDAQTVGLIAAALPVDQRAFVRDCLDGFEDLALMARGRHVAQVMHRHLDPDPAIAVEQVARGIAAPLGFGYLAHSEFIGTVGLPAFDESMSAQHALTQAFTAEFSIRPFIERYPRTMLRLREWAADPSEHVRRLVSEGTRPRLPWAARLPAFQADPAPVVELLEMLKDDRSPYVQRSVGNNLNDISRDNPEVALEVAARWAPGRGALIRRGRRTLVKAADPRALAVLGYATCDVSARAVIPRSVAIGDKLPIEVVLTGHGQVIVDLRIHFVRASGATSPKVFRGAEIGVDGQATLRRTISFAHHSTRRPYPGPHRIEALVNGTPHELGVVEVREGPGAPPAGAPPPGAPPAGAASAGAPS